MDLVKNKELNLDKNRCLSLYDDEIVEMKTIMECVKKIKSAFPELPVDWFDQLIESVKRNNFTRQRLLDATFNLIDTCVYPKPTVANFIIYDKKVKTYTYQEMLNLINQVDNGVKSTDNFQFLAKDVWVLKTNLNG